MKFSKSKPVYFRQNKILFTFRILHSYVYTKIPNLDVKYWTSDRCVRNKQTQPHTSNSGGNFHTLGREKPEKFSPIIADNSSGRRTMAPTVPSAHPTNLNIKNIWIINKNSNFTKGSVTVAFCFHFGNKCVAIPNVFEAIAIDGQGGARVFAYFGSAKLS